MEYEKYFSPDVIAAGTDLTIPFINRVFELKNAGVPLVRMDMGVPDVPCPVRATEAAVAALERGENAYTNPAGLPELRRTISEKYQRERHLYYDPETSIIVTAGASEAMMTITGTLLSSGDEVIVPTPGYSAYFYTFTAQGFKVIEVPTVKDYQVHLDLAAFEAAVTPRTKMIVVNTPQNPTGHVYSRQELEMIADIAVRHDLLVLADECYEKFVWDGDFMSIAELPGMQERTIIMSSVSKTYGMTGWRVGYILAPAALSERMKMYHGNGFVCAASFMQFGAEAAITGETEEEISAFREAFIERRKALLDGLDEIGVLPYIAPQGAFYLLVDVSVTGMDGAAFSMNILEEKGVAVFPGPIFGEAAKNYIRLSYACPLEDIERALQLIREYVEELTGGAE